MKIAGVQMNVALGDTQHNLARIAEFVRETRAQGVHLTVFPECAVTGYCFESLTEARPHAQSIPGPATEFLRKACSEFGGWVVCGMLESSGDRLFNAAVLVGPNGVAGAYRKVHLPFLGVDRFTTH